MRVEIREDPFHPWETLTQCEQEGGLKPGDFGATAVFVGTMRDFNEGDTVKGMTLEHYPGMTERELEIIVAEAEDRWPLQEMLVVHRVGWLEPGDPIVLVAAWTAHRAAAFEACRYVMEALKSRAPFWKKEQLVDRARWVARNAGTPSR